MQLCRADFDERRWVEAAPLPFNSPDYSTMHPALSDDGETLYFSSDMPGGYGSFDLYRVAVNGGAFAVPVNLGGGINTERREQFPFLSADRKLYFSSDGHGGYGALDIVTADILPDGFDTVKNVGLPVNSGYDDFSFYINSDTREGYFASNRPGGKGSDDIYRLKETRPLVIEDCAQAIAGTVTDKDSGLPIGNAAVTLSGPEDVPIATVTTPADGSFRFPAGCSTGYTISATKAAYSKDTKRLLLKDERGKVHEVSLVLQSDAARRSADAAAEKLQKERDAATAKQQQKDRIADIMAKEKDVVRDGDRLLIRTEPIYFDYDLWYIRKESKPILNRVIGLMKKYPAMVVEIGSHTDVRGTAEYNRALSSKRAASTRDYFLENGIPESRISAKGYGESRPIIRCVPDEACSEEQHELNRRSEFVIQNL
jgi:outer membrane protein OmpA-like peptidoglycan-associated protein